MFDLGWSEMAVIVLVALIVIGPKDLPRVARTLGKWTAKGRAMARDFQRSLEDMARETELDKVKTEIEKAGRVDLGSQIEKTIDPSGDLKGAFDPADGDRAATVKDGKKGKSATNGTTTAAAASDKAEPAVSPSLDEPAESPRPTHAAQS